MSEARGFILFVNPQGWTIALSSAGQERTHHIEGSANASPQVSAKLVADTLAALNCRANKVMVALADDACFYASISTEGLSRRGGGRALLYRLEEKLPLAVEDAKIQFVPNGKRALGVGTRRQTIEPILQALEKENFKVVAACPLALLALQGIQISRGKSLTDETDAILWQDGPNPHLFLMEKGKLAGCVSLPADPVDLNLALASSLVARSKQMQLACVGVDAEIMQSIQAFPEVVATHHEGTTSLSASLASASALFANSASPIVDFRHADVSSQSFASPQNRFAFISALAAALLLIACLIGSLLYRAGRYSDSARQAQSEKEAIFHRLFPNQTVPVSIESRLQSTARELEHKGGVAGSGNVGPDTLSSLHEILKNLPTDVRYSVSDLDLDANHLSLQGEVRSHADADSVALALRRLPLFSIDDPQTQQGAKGTVQFTISGTLHGPVNSPRREP